VCAHPYLFLDRLQPPYAPADPAELVRASGKLALLDAALPKLRAAGHRVLLFSQARPAAGAQLRAWGRVRVHGRGAPGRPAPAPAPSAPEAPKRPTGARRRNRLRAQL